MSDMDESQPDNLPAKYQPAALSINRMLMPDPASDAIRLNCRSGSEYEYGRLMMLNAPDTVQRELISKRHKEIVNNLSEHNQREIAAAVADVIACYRNFVKADEDPKKVITKYVKELHGIPTWACVRACAAIRDNQAPKISKDYPFSTIALRDLAESYIRRLQDEAREISEILLGGALPPPVDPEIKARIQRGLARLAHKMKAERRSENEAYRNPLFQREGQETDAYFLQAYKRLGLEPQYANGRLLPPELSDQMKQGRVE